MRYTARIRTPGDIALALQQARLHRGLTQSELAKLLDIPQARVSEIESGATTGAVRRILEFAAETGLELYGTWGDDAPER